MIVLTLLTQEQRSWLTFCVAETQAQNMQADLHWIISEMIDGFEGFSNMTDRELLGCWSEFEIDNCREMIAEGEELKDGIMIASLIAVVDTL